MSEMSYLEKLLDGVEVEWVTLGSMADIGTGSSNRQDESENGIYPFYVRSKNILKSDTFEFDEVAIVIPGEGGIGDIFHYVEGKYALHQRAYRIRITTNAVDTKFLYYFMSSSFKQYILTKSVGATAISIRKPMLEGFKVPIPSPDNPEKSLAIQSEIVRILDKFTALTAELTAELNMRKKQYNYYRDQLLSFEDGEVEWKALGTICQIGDGNHSSKYPKANEMIEQGIPFIRGTNMVNGTICNQDMKYISKEKHNELKKGHLKAFDVLIANRGEVGKVAYVPEGYSGSNLNSQLAWLRANPEIIINRYLFFILCSSTIQNKLSGEGGALQQLTIKNIKNIQIPVPSITVQSNIVSFLDKFDSLTNSISEGLPREIELRQKQYEYYRDLLFSFPKPDTVSN
ncbi:restriction endonuclease subunit S [Escherichia coli]|uniref:restriction endonuclease subunit S n=2 Tax=Escherichia TaxID=561 RepID=UPI0010AADE26|nr:restriction endonuclease subunit S [Escherichia coli]EFO5386511.1 restriction endonuclease subunit S [Escherichia coli]EME4627441.1 restriction endonuclease subunit S [Escherichia coli]MBZ2375742.1 restriction endonuclease subunit S [Escherichia coli]MDZ3880306.1 restriction endonuclease subunit S [Escherichia coli]HAW1418271.1 restriction endonuclease subunit S [Escherichia coli]